MGAGIGLLSTWNEGAGREVRAAIFHIWASFAARCSRFRFRFRGVRGLVDRKADPRSAFAAKLAHNIAAVPMASEDATAIDAADWSRPRRQKAGAAGVSV
jgi:hypothetical protein